MPDKEKAAKPRVRVLLVDDEKSIRITLQTFLAEANCNVRTAAGVAEATELLERCEFDVAVCDVILPDGNGAQLLKTVQQRLPHVKVVMITGDPAIEAAVEAVRGGAVDFLLKPVTRNGIVRAVGHAAEIKRLEDETRRLEAANRRYRENLEQLVEDRTRELQTANTRLERTLVGTVRAMARTVEFRDPYTAGHQQRVAVLGEAVARKSGLPDDTCRTVFLAGIIHDLGKISVPSEILAKPGRLTDAEFRLIRAHPQTGADILRTVDFPWPIARIVAQHHERCDGSGYPAALRSDAILREARILAVSDVVEAMAAHRPYRPALGIDAALLEIRSGRGDRFDPATVDACLELFASGEFRFDYEPEQPFSNRLPNLAK